jgi:hypothetical protein
MSVNTPVVPDQHLLAGKPYVIAAATDVQATWLRHGWTPPDRRRQQEIREQLNRLQPLVEEVTQ